MDAYEKVNSAWKLTCRVVLGDEVGELKDFEPWLREYFPPTKREKSALDGKEVSLSSSDYCPSAKFLSFDQVDFKKKFDPLDIDELKDIDSVVQAVQERIYYTGNIVLGSSQLVEKSSDIIDSFYIYHSSIVSDSKYIVYGDSIRRCQYLFGVSPAGESSYGIHGIDASRGTKCFESHTVFESQDCYYSVRPEGCTDVMFCFGAIGKHYAIGNLVLPREKYLALKGKLLAEMREILQRDKRIFSLFDLIVQAGKPKSKLRLETPEEKTSKGPIEQAFSQTTNIVLGKPLTGIDQYGKFLWKHVRPIYPGESCLSGKEFVIPDSFYQAFKSRPKLRERIVTEEEMRKIGEIAVKPEALEGIALEPESLAVKLQEVAYLSPTIIAGNNSNLIRCTFLHNSHDCYEGSGYVYAKKCGYCFWPRESEHIFGSAVTWSSSFCLKSHSSKRLARCFEVDGCENCSDLYYSHNCENVHDSMFCFNVKNLRNAIGNAPLAPEEYKKIKQSVLEQLVAELEKNKDLRWDIYNVGCAKNQR